MNSYLSASLQAAYMYGHSHIGRSGPTYTVEPRSILATIHDQEPSVAAVTIRGVLHDVSYATQSNSRDVMAFFFPHEYLGRLRREVVVPGFGWAWEHPHLTLFGVPCYGSTELEREVRIIWPTPTVRETRP